MKRQEIKEILKSDAFGSTVKVSGWVRTKRESKNVNFINLNDGTVIHNLQIVADVNNFDENLLKKINTGAALTVIGELTQSGGQQQVGVVAKEIEVVGEHARQPATGRLASGPPGLGGCRGPGCGATPRGEGRAGVPRARRRTSRCSPGGDRRARGGGRAPWARGPPWSRR